MGDLITFGPSRENVRCRRPSTARGRWSWWRRWIRRHELELPRLKEERGGFRTFSRFKRVLSAEGVKRVRPPPRWSPSTSPRWPSSTRRCRPAPRRLRTRAPPPPPPGSLPRFPTDEGKSRNNKLEFNCRNSQQFSQQWWKSGADLLLRFESQLERRHI